MANGVTKNDGRAAFGLLRCPEDEPDLYDRRCDDRDTKSATNRG